MLNLYSEANEIHLNLLRNRLKPTDAEITEMLEDYPDYPVNTDSADEATPESLDELIDVRSLVKAKFLAHLNDESITGLQWQTELILEAIKNYAIYDLLKYFDAPSSWISLYKIYETIENEYTSRSSVAPTIQRRATDLAVQLKIMHETMHETCTKQGIWVEI